MSLLSQLKERNREPEITDPAFYDDQMGAAIHELDHAGISLMDYPEATRHRAFVLEGKITDAANEGRREDFDRLLIEWRGCFN